MWLQHAYISENKAQNSILLGIVLTEIHYVWQIYIYICWNAHENAYKFHVDFFVLIAKWYGNEQNLT